MSEELPVTVLFEGTDGVIWTKLFRGHGQKAMLMAHRSHTQRSRQSPNEYSCEEQCSPTSEEVLELVLVCFNVDIISF